MPLGSRTIATSGRSTMESRLSPLFSSFFRVPSQYNCGAFIAGDKSKVDAYAQKGRTPLKKVGKSLITKALWCPSVCVRATAVNSNTQKSWKVFFYLTVLSLRQRSLWTLQNLSISKAVFSRNGSVRWSIFIQGLSPPGKPKLVVFLASLLPFQLTPELSSAIM